MYQEEEEVVQIAWQERNHFGEIEKFFVLVLKNR